MSTSSLTKDFTYYIILLIRSDYMKRLKSIFFVVLSFLIVATTTIPIYAFEKDIVIDNSKYVRSYSHTIYY